MNRKHNEVVQVDSLIDSANNISIECKTKQIFLKTNNQAKVLFVEPFYGGSHKQLLDVLMDCIPNTFVGLSAKKWPWRARCSALILSEQIPPIKTESILFCSSVLSLAELLGLRGDLNKLKKIVYFHENQLIYPIREIKERDIQFAYNQITTCLAADVVIFNSNFNKDSFLENIQKIIKLLPDYRPKNIQQKISSKCRVIYFPVKFPNLTTPINLSSNVLVIVWPHRWEFDKDPETMIQILFDLKRIGCKFKVYLLGEVFQDVPDIFKKAKEELSEEILSCGYVESKEDYFEKLSESHVAVSTARHEFFGVSMLEATYCGCFPLVPNRLVYPEIYPNHCLYKTNEELFERLSIYSKYVSHVIEDRKRLEIDFHKYSIETLLPEYINVLKYFPYFF